MDKVSIIVPIYNTRKDFLTECLDSIREQTYKNIEIIMVDDGSNEVTAKVCDDIAKCDDRVKIFHKKNEGVSVARNFGIEKSTGDWICFVDSDDWLEKDAIEEMLREKNKTKIIFSNFFRDSEKIQYDIEWKKTTEIESSEVVDALFYQNRYKHFFLESACGKLYLRDFLIKENIFFPVGVPRGEDMLFNLECYVKAKKISYTLKYTYHYRLNVDSATQIFDKDFVEKSDILLMNVEKKIYSFNNNDSYKEYFNFFVVRHLHNNCYRYIFNNKNQMSLKEKYKFLKEMLQREPYSTAIKNVNFKNMSLKRVIIVLAVRLKWYYLLSVIYVFKNVNV